MCGAAISFWWAAMSYYEKAFRLAEARLDQPEYFVFSDDLPWARENLPAPRPATFVDANTQKAAHEDLRLMAACRHHILANSSFSWWGAWLGAQEGALNIAPRYWMMRPDTQYPRLCPQGWILVDNLPGTGWSPGKKNA
jgi:hypothetical protein